MLFFFLVSLLLMLIACQQDFSPLEPKMIIREAADLSNLSLSNLDPSYLLVKNRQFFISEYRKQEGICYLVHYRYQWRNSLNQFLHLELLVAESYSMAMDLLKMEWEISSIYHGGPRPQDHPVVAGTISYEDGRTFIRDNLIVKIRSEDDSSLNPANLAVMADRQLLKAATHSDLADVQPIIRKFEITKNPVQLWGSTKLNIAVLDPLGSTVTYDWRFSDGHGGIWKEGNEYFFQTYFDEPAAVQLRLIAFSQAGFSTWSEITVIVER